MTSVNKKYLSYILKAAIIILAYAFIYQQFIKKEADIKRFETLLDHIGQKQVLLIMPLIFYLMLVNWVLESLKWKYLTRKLISISVWKAVECVFCGLTWAVFTPNRLGEYGGRIMFLPPRKRVYGIFAMAVGSFGQNVITNVLGTIAVLWFTATFLHFNAWVYTGFLILGIAYIAIFLICYFHMKWLVFILDRVPFIKKYHRFFGVMGEYKFKELFRIMLFCMARFFTFSLQYYMLIHLFIPRLGAFEILMMTFIVFFIQSALPSLDLLDVAVRSAIAASVFAYITNQQIAVVAVFSAILIINLIIPAIIGTFFNLKLNFFDRNT